MAERTDQLSYEDEASEVDLNTIVDDRSDVAETADTDTDTSSGIRARIGARIGNVFSIQAFVLAVVLSVGLAFAAGAVIPFVPDNIAGLVGIFLAGGVIGTGSGSRRYLEVGAAALMTGALTILLSNFTVAVFGPGAPLVAVGATSSGIAGLVGHYVGRDFRAGLTRDIE